MIPSLTPILVGELAPFAETLVLADDPRPAIPSRDLTRHSTLESIMDRAVADLGEGDIRARMSLWAIDYVHYLMPLTVVAQLALGRRLPVALDETAVILDDEAMPIAIRIRDDGCVSDERDPFESFAPMIRGHLQPLFEVWAAFSGIAPRVLWTNAANLYEAILRELEREPGFPRGVTDEANRLVTESHWPDGWRNPFQNPVIYRPDHPKTQRWRRVCCVRYLIPRYRYCSNCPHLLAESAG